MCGACGERDGTDWARALCAGLPARSAVATALHRLAARPALDIVARPGGWLVRRPTGASTVCTGLTALVAAVRSAVGPDTPDRPTGYASGPLTVPAPDGRHGVRLRVAEDAAPTGEDSGWQWTVPTEDEAHAALACLAGPSQSLRCYLAELSGVTAPWGRPTVPTAAFGTPGQAADLVVWAEWARQAGTFDRAPFAARCPLDRVTVLDLEVRAGLVVRAVPLPEPECRTRGKSGPRIP